MSISSPWDVPRGPQLLKRKSQRCGQSLTMISGSRKRKHRSHRSQPQSPPSTPVKFLSHYEGYNHPRTHDPDATKPDALHALYIQAYEADLVRGSQAKTAAQSLELVEYSALDPGGEVTIIPKIGSALIRWGGDDTTSIGKTYGDEDDMLPHATQSAETPIWVDRYDARLLLDTLPKPSVPASQPDSPTGWSDLPSDTEDTFFFTPDETEDFRREKRRRLLEQTREERLKARMEEDDVEDEENQEEEDVWGGSDEEPDDPQQELMRRTATHLLSSPNAAQLEMRILANYGSDKRFAFLRGRWSRRWNLIKLKARLDKEKEKEKDQPGKEMNKESQAGLGLVTGYGSDDSSDGGSDAEGKDVVATALNIPPAEPPDSTEAVGEGNVEEAAKEARRKRAKEWAEKRREMKLKGDTI
ncbi:hypothetical protein BYT27DRAFT_7170480 [Phlegmacium glaucopus]|nr:hypothetical protein BYT27DRAFT_7170480 [Phlegmacium glaucopus]